MRSKVKGRIARHMRIPVMTRQTGSSCVPSDLVLVYFSTYAFGKIRYQSSWRIDHLLEASSQLGVAPDLGFPSQDQGVVQKVCHMPAKAVTHGNPVLIPWLAEISKLRQPCQRIGTLKPPSEAHSDPPVSAWKTKLRLAKVPTHQHVKRGASSAWNTLQPDPV